MSQSGEGWKTVEHSKQARPQSYEKKAAHPTPFIRKGAVEVTPVSKNDPSISSTYFGQDFFRTSPSHQSDNKRMEGVAVCKFFATGSCRYGENCNLGHIRSEQDIPLSPSLTSNLTSCLAPSSIPSGSLELNLDTFKRKLGKSEMVLESEMLPTASLADLRLDDRTDSTSVTQLVGEPRFGTVSFAQLAQLNADNKSKGIVSISPPTTSLRAIPVADVAPFIPTQVLMGSTSKYSDLCAFAMVGKCRYGNLCRSTHGIQCPRCCNYCLHPTDMDRNEEHIEECLGKTDVLSPIDMRQVECGLCSSKIATKEDPRFGLLNCDHAFCLSCIRTWRAQHSMHDLTTKSCPLCREITFFIVPSSTWTIDKTEKRKIIDAYKRKLGQISCKYFNSGDRVCPFGTSCFYSHRHADGSMEKLSFRSYVDKDERQQVVRETRLCDFIDFQIGGRAEMK